MNPNLTAVSTTVAASNDNPFKLVARYRKAKKIALHLVQMGANAETTESLGKSEVGRTLAAEASGTHVPSEITWALVVEMVKEIAG